MPAASDVVHGREHEDEPPRIPTAKSSYRNRLVVFSSHAQDTVNGRTIPQKQFDEGATIDDWATIRN